jgi:hypothetical protein
MSADVVTPRIRLLESSIDKEKLGQLEQRLGRLEADHKTLLAQLRILTLDYEAAKLSKHLEEWHYDVLEPNFYFNSLYHVELMESGDRKRWVDQTGRIAHCISIPRDLHYTLTVHVVDFANEGYTGALRLRVDGKPVPWSSVEGMVYTADIATLVNAFKLLFEIYIDPEVLVPELSVSFSFRKISIVRGSSSAPPNEKSSK